MCWVFSSMRLLRFIGTGYKRIGYLASKYAKDEDDSEENNEKSKPKTKKPGHRKKKKNVTFDQ